MLNKKSLWTIIGFLLFLFGFLSMILYLFAGGLQIQFLSFIDNFGTVASFVIRLVMIFGGIVIFYVARTGNELE